MREKFYVTRYGSRFAVRFPDGLIRCIVKSEEFAEEICRDLTNEALSGWATGKRKESGRRTKPVRCIDTGEVFVSQKIASQKTGISQDVISRDCLGKIKHPAKPRPRFEWAL